MAVTLEELQIRFTAQMGGLTSQLNGVKKQLGGVTASAGKASTAMAGLAKMAKLFIGVYLVRGMVKIGKESLNMANDVVESEQLFAVSMKGMGDAARDWSDDLSASLGLNAYSLRKSVGIFNTMFMSMGLGTDKAYELSTGLVELAQDMSSFYNISSEEAFTKLRAGITGETEPLKQLGILVDENTTKQYALSTGISDTAKNMTQSQKVLARYEAILGQTADAQGDLARTISSPVNQIRILGNTLDMAKIALGQAFQPIQAIVLPLLSSLAQAALSAANALKTFMWALTGFTGIGANAGAIAGAGADANEDLTDSLNDSAKAYKAAGGAAKKASKDAKVGLKAFDEINKITEENAEKGGGGGISEKPEITAPEEQSAAMEALGVAVSKAADWLKKLWDLALPTREAMSRLWDSLSRFGGLVWDGLVWFYEKFLVPIGKWTVTRALPAFLDVLTAAVNLVNVAMEAAGPVVQMFYDRILVPLGKWAGEKIIDALKWLKEKLDGLADWISNNQEAYGEFVEVLFSFGAGIIAVWAASKLILTVSAAFGTLKAMLLAFTSPAGIIALIIGGLIWCALNWELVKRTAIDAWAGIERTWATFGNWFKTNVTDPMAREFNQAWEYTKQGFSNLWYYVDLIFIAPFRAAWVAVPEPIKRAFKDLWDFIDRIFIKPFRELWAWLTGLEDVNKNVNIHETTYVKRVNADGTTTDYGGTGGKIPTKEEQTKNQQKLISDMNTLFPSDKPKTGGLLGLLGFARGGVFEANKPILGLLGDQKSGRNIETPEKLLRQIFQQEVISGVRQTPSVSSAPINSNGNVVQQAVEAVLDRLQITLNVDGETWGRASVKHINNAQRMSGRVLLEM